MKRAGDARPRVFSARLVPYRKEIGTGAAADEGIARIGDYGSVMREVGWAGSRCSE
jgi:hypothetical protein